MKKLYLLKTMLLLCALVVGSASSWAADETIDFSSKKFENGLVVEDVSGTDCTISFYKGTNSSEPKYYDTGKAIRLYGGNYMVVSATKTISKIELTFASGEGTNAITTDVNTYSNGTWTGEASSVKFTIGGSSGHRRIKTVAVTYKGDAPSYTITPISNNVDYGTVSLSGNVITASPAEGYRVSTTTPYTVISGTANVAQSGNVFTVTASSDCTVQINFEAIPASVDYATLPFVWEGGVKQDLLGLDGVTANGLGSDYALSNAPYCVRFDNTGDYIQIKTGSQPGKVTIGVKIFGNGTSTITVQGSTDGETFTKVEDLSISGAQNAVLTLETTNAFNADVRYVRFLFTKVANVGVGPISIDKASTDPVINCDETIKLGCNDTDNEFAYSIVNPVDGTQLSAASTDNWISNIVVGSDKITFNTTANTGNARTGTITLTYGDLTKAVSVNQAKYTYTYRLATEVVPGRHYIITNGENVALGEQRNNNRGGATVNVEGSLITIDEGYVAELLLGIDSETGFITFFDESSDDNGGYLYAVSSSDNYLRVQATNDANGKWNVFFNESDGSVQIVAQGTNSRNILRYNSQNSIFSCYASGQGNVYLYERVDDAGDVTGVTAPIKVTDAEYATIFKPYALDFGSTGITAYTAIDGESSVTLNEITSRQVPANTPVVLYKAGGCEVNVPVIAEADDVDDNDLRISDGTNPTNAYVLANKNDIVGFYKWAGTSLSAGKVYLQSKSNNTRSYLPFSETTGISEVENSKSVNGKYYDLQGRRVVKAQKGLYIMDGKKVLVK